MSFNPLKNWRTRRLERALGSYDQNPGVGETELVVRLALKCGRPRKAYEIAEKGCLRFPQSRELSAFRQQAFRELGLEECQALARKLNGSPRPETVAKLIEIRRSIGDFSICEKLIRRWKSRFPASWILQFAIGKFLFQKSLLEKNPRTSQRCVDQLEEAAILDPRSYKTLLYLATILYQLGFVSRAQMVAQQLLEAHPGDPRAISLWERIHVPLDGTDAEPAADTAGEGSTSASSSPVSEEEAAFLALQENQHLYATLIEVDEEEGTRIVSFNFANNSPFQFDRGEAAFSDLIHSFKVASQRMGLGELKTCILEGGSWKIFLVRSRGKSLLACADKRFKDENLLKYSQKIIPEEAVV